MQVLLNILNQIDVYNQKNTQTTASIYNTIMIIKIVYYKEMIDNRAGLVVTYILNGNSNLYQVLTYEAFQCIINVCRHTIYNINKCIK